MNYHINNGGQTSGPFTEDQLRTMLSEGTVSTTTLAWREGTADWKPLSEFLGSPAQPPSLAQPSSATQPPFMAQPQYVAQTTTASGPGSKLGVVSLIYGIVSAIIWVALFAVAGAAQIQGKATPQFNMVIGALAIGGLGLNLGAMILGIVGAVKSVKKGVAIAGAIVNGFELCGVFLLILIGIGMSAHVQS